MLTSHGEEQIIQEVNNDDIVEEVNNDDIAEEVNDMPDVDCAFDEDRSDDDNLDQML